MKHISNIAYQLQYLTISFILDLQENIYEKNKKTYYMSAGFAGRHVVGFGDLSIDVFLAVRNKRYSWILYLTDYIVYGLHLLYNWVLASEPWLLKVLAHFHWNLILLTETKPRNNIVYEIQYLTTPFILDLEEKIHT